MLNDKGLEIIFESLKENTTLEALFITHNNISGTSIIEPTEIFKNTALYALDLSHNKIRNVLGINEYIKCFDGLRDLSFKDNPIGDKSGEEEVINAINLSKYIGPDVNLFRYNGQQSVLNLFQTNISEKKAEELRDLFKLKLYIMMTDYPDRVGKTEKLWLSIYIHSPNYMNFYRMEYDGNLRLGWRSLKQFMDKMQQDWHKMPHDDPTRKFEKLDIERLNHNKETPAVQGFDY
jgi:hypothetical protein